MSATPRYGEIWLADLVPTVGREQDGRRPVLVISPDRFNRGPLVVCMPLTRTRRGSPLHVEVAPPEGGLKATSFVLCEMVRSISRRRLVGTPWGVVSVATMRSAIANLRTISPAP